MPKFWRAIAVLLAVAYLTLSVTVLPAFAATGGRNWTGFYDWATTWIGGLVCGIAVALATRINWRLLPGRIANFLSDQRHRAGWAMVGSFFLAVIVFY